MYKLTTDKGANVTFEAQNEELLVKVFVQDKLVLTHTASELEFCYVETEARTVKAIKIGEKFIPLGKGDKEGIQEEFASCVQQARRTADAKVQEAENTPEAQSIIKEIAKRRRQARKFDEMFNEGGEGYNPYRS